MSIVIDNILKATFLKRTFLQSWARSKHNLYLINVAVPWLREFKFLYSTGSTLRHNIRNQSVFSSFSRTRARVGNDEYFAEGSH